MKTLFLSILFITNGQLFAQTTYTNKFIFGTKAPIPVQQSFQKINPEVQDASWSKHNLVWRVNYRDNTRRNVDAYYDCNGNLKDIHRSLDKMDVPRFINMGITKRYGGNYRVTKIERANEDPVYQITIQKQGSSHIVYMDGQGKLIEYTDSH